MIKLFGAVIVFSSCLLLCISPIYRKNQRIHFLHDIISLLHVMEQELNTNMLTLAELIESCIEKSSAPLRNSMERIQEEIAQNGAAYLNDCWIKEMVNYTHYLQWEEQNELNRLGNILGQYLITDQMNALHNTISCLENGYKIAKDELKNYTKVSCGMGIAIGLMVVIVLL